VHLLEAAPNLESTKNIGHICKKYILGQLTFFVEKQNLMVDIMFGREYRNYTPENDREVQQAFTR
jgi:hypothetical protein